VGPVSLGDRHGPVHICRGCQNAANWDACDAELPRHELTAGKGCTTCRRRGQPCQILVDEYDDDGGSSGSSGSSGQGNVVTLGPRPDGLTPPLCCDPCLEDPAAGIAGCSFRSDYRGAQEPRAPCRRCAAAGRLCTIGGYYFFGASAQATLLPITTTTTTTTATAVPTQLSTPSAAAAPLSGTAVEQQPLRFASHLGAARPTHLFLTKRLDCMANGGGGSSTCEPLGRPIEDCVVRIQGLRDVYWSLAQGGGEMRNRNVGLYMPEGALAPLPELWRYVEQPGQSVNGGIVSGEARGGGIFSLGDLGKGV
jgi:hypothetical protein